METNFYIGQEVVAIKDHSKGLFKKGDEFVIQGIKKEHCCGVITLNVGFLSDYYTMKCALCGRRYINDNYYVSTSFAPKQQLSDTTYNEIQEWIKQGNELSILN